VIKIKILAVGRMTRVFMFLQFVASFLVLDPTEKSRKGGELKSITGSAKLLYGTLAFGTEGIKDAISGFDDAYVSLSFPKLERSSPPRRKSDIENKRLPPELFDAEEAKAFLALHAHSQSLPKAPLPGDHFWVDRSEHRNGLVVCLARVVRVSRAWAGLRRPPRRGRRRARCRSGDDMDIRRVLGQRGRVRRTEAEFGEYDFCDSGGVG
jgi:hypothetical protein